MEKAKVDFNKLTPRQMGLFLLAIRYIYNGLGQNPTINQVSDSLRELEIALHSDHSLRIGMGLDVGEGEGQQGTEINTSNLNQPHKEI